MDDTLTPTADPITEIEEEKKEEVLEEVKDLASIIDHPGWQKIEQRFMEDIESFRTGNALAEHIKGADDKVLGQAFRVEYMVAERLENYLEDVREAAKVVDDAVKREKARRDTGK